MGPAIYILAAVTSLTCSVLLLRRYSHGRRKLLLWSGLCFAALTVSNGLVFVDLVMVPEINLYRWRLGAAAIGMLMLVYGLIWESE